MERGEAILLGLFALLVLGTAGYVLFRLWRDPRPQNISAESQRLARSVGMPKLLDPLLARPHTRREKLGWLLVLIVMVLAVVSTGGAHEF
jgi:hypothetical protein